jgi:4-hydroxy-2-oxoheptanedioate aldolase
MVETVGALEAVDDLASTPGVDGLFVGPLDLALALGTTVEDVLEDRSPDSVLGRVVDAATRHGILVGAFAGTPVNAAALRAHGIHCLAVTTDLGVVSAGVQAVLDADGRPRAENGPLAEGGPPAVRRLTVEE